MTSYQVYRRVLTLVAALALSAALTPLAHAADATLLTAADGPAFSIGATPYRIVTSARAVAGAGGEPSARASSFRGDATVASIGDYAIVMGDAGGGRVARTASSTAYLVAVNQRSGAPALVSRRLKLFKVSADQAALAAKRTGGAVDTVVPVASMAILVYPTPDAALAALDTIRGGVDAANVEPEVIQAFMKPR